MRAWKEEFEEIFSSLHRVSSELEQANAQIKQQKEVIARFPREKAALHRQLQPQNASDLTADVPMDDDEDEKSSSSSSSSDCSVLEMTSDRDVAETMAFDNQ